MQAYADCQATGAGVFALDGKMVDMPMVKMAERVLDKAKATGLLIDG